MASRALTQGSTSFSPKLFYRKVVGTRSIEIWTTTCIVTNFKNVASILINPSNPELSGVSNFPYFPRGGPVPNPVDSMHKDWQPLGFVSQWGGMEVGSGMLYPVMVVDGLVHQLGGLKLQAECRLKKALAMGDDACPVGQAVLTSAGNGELSQSYDLVVHTTPPFFRYDEEPQSLLRSCYRAAFSLAFAQQQQTTKKSAVATPLLGAGARGFPIDDAIEIAASSADEWQRKGEGGGKEELHNDDNFNYNLVFGLQEIDHAKKLKRMLKDI